jgi:hypothetical protein
VKNGRDLEHARYDKQIFNKRSTLRDEVVMAKNRLHKYVGIDTPKRILGGSIRMTQPGGFNDPFELLPELIIPADQAGKPISFSFDIHAPRRETPLTAVVQLTDGREASDITSRHILDVLNQQIGILCLSKAPNSILMWSHYADQYQGAVVAFDADHEFFAGQIEVEYVEERPRKHIDSYTPEAVPVAELCAKSIEWQYERKCGLCASSRTAIRRKRTN